MKFISEALANWQLERLEALVSNTRSKARANKLRSSSLVCEHLNLADECLDEAISAMKYHRYDQASFACQAGFVQMGLCELLLQHGTRIDAGLRTASKLIDATKKRKDDDELASYLASMLAEMKVAIEYSNCKVNPRPQTVLDRAMDYYNDSLKALKNSDEEKSRYAAQAGLLCLHLASEIIGVDNQMALPGWRGLSNPMLVSPLRRASVLVEHLADTRKRLHQKEKALMIAEPKEEAEKTAFLRKHWEKAFSDFLLAVDSLSEGRVSHGQALLKSAIREMESCLEIIGIEDPDELANELEGESSEIQGSHRQQIADALSLLAEVKDIIQDRKMPRKEYVLISLDRVTRLYKEGQRNFNSGHFRWAEKNVAEALLELDLIRQQIHMRRRKDTGAHSVGPGK